MTDPQNPATAATLERLAATIAKRAGDSPQESWTARLLGKGISTCAQKLGEEAVETIIAACENDQQAIISESADLLYHWLVLLKATGVEPNDVYEELRRREGRSGLDEKASRGKTGNRS